MSRFVLAVGKRDHFRANGEALNTLLEYGDYECPDCGRAHATVQKIEAQAGDGLRFVFRNFPLAETHAHAFGAACAAEAAALQDRFWQMHDTIFENQEQLSAADLSFYAERLGLNLRQFERDRKSEAIAQRVREDFMSGVRSGVNGTPTFFINGRRHDGPYDYPYLLAAIDQAAGEVTHG
jgi:protein-disulfide isomerase